MKFYANRLDRVVLTATLTMLAAAALGKITGVVWYVNGDPADLTAPRLVACLTYFHWYVDAASDEYQCPNTPVWTVGALIPSWLLYPLYRRLLVAAAERGQRATTAALLLLAAGWAVTFGVIFAICAAEGFDNTERQTAWSYFFPPAQLGDFMLGVATAALALRAVADAPAPGEVAPLQGTTKDGAASEGAKAGAWVARWARESWVGLLADAAVLTVACLIVLLPMVGRENSTGWEPLLQHALAPLFALWLLATTVGSPAAPGGVARVLRHPALASMGKYSFHVYLLHTLVVLVVTAAGLDVTAAPNIVALLLVTSLLAGLYCEFVEAPLVKLCRAGFKACRSRMTKTPAIP